MKQWANLRARLRRALMLCCGLLQLVALSAAAQPDATYLSLVKEFFPQAERLQTLEGEPRASGVHGTDRLLGYAFLTDQVTPIPAYSGRPISTLVVFDLAGEIRGVRIIKHQEPILVVGITEQDLARYTEQYIGKRVDEGVKIGGAERDGYRTIDGISGATITVMVLNRAIMVAAKKVAVTHAPARRETGGQSTPIAASEATLGALEAEPIWVHAWERKSFRTGLLIAGLVVLGLILTFQDWLANHPQLLRGLRYGYLMFTLFYIGWYSLAQLSVVNVLTFLSALMHGFQWDTFLIEPMLFVLWSFVVVTIVLWGRGVYCGWLCPFGALQELGFRLAKKLRVPTWEFPQVVHDRLVAIKYIVVILLFGASMGSLESAVRYAEIEPFKTAITLRFMREWWYVAFAAGLVLVSCVNRKFYCRYLCPLGAALTFPGRFRIFNWLRRRKECGRPCQTCANECEVRAIGPTGEINDTECHYCLDCQITYWNDRKCPPLVEKRKRRERGERARPAESSVTVPLPGREL